MAQDESEVAALQAEAEKLEAANRDLYRKRAELKAERAQSGKASTPGCKSVAEILAPTISLTKAHEAEAARREDPDAAGNAGKPVSPDAKSIHKHLHELSRSDEQSGKRGFNYAWVPREILCTPAYRSLNGIETRVLTALYLRCRRADGISRPGWKTIARDLGMDPESKTTEKAIYKALSAIRSAGLLWCRSAAGWKRASVYYLARNQKHVDYIKGLIDTPNKGTYESITGTPNEGT